MREVLVITYYYTILTSQHKIQQKIMLILAATSCILRPILWLKFGAKFFVQNRRNSNWLTGVPVSQSEITTLLPHTLLFHSPLLS